MSSIYNRCLNSTQGSLTLNFTPHIHLIILISVRCNDSLFLSRVSAKHPMHAERDTVLPILSVRPSVRPSVCPSVCQSVHPIPVLCLNEWTYRFCNTTRPSVRALVRVRVSVTIITRRGSCGFCPSFVTTIYTRAHRLWWRVSTV